MKGGIIMPLDENYTDLVNFVGSRYARITGEMRGNIKVEHARHECYIEIEMNLLDEDPLPTGEYGSEYNAEIKGELGGVMKFIQRGNLRIVKIIYRPR